MSYYIDEEVLLENNIRVKEMELLQIITDDMVQYLNEQINPNIFPDPRAAYYDGFHLSLPSYYFTHAQVEFSKATQHGLQITDNHSRDVMQQSGLVMPKKQSNNSNPTIRKYRRSAKTYQGINLYKSYSSPYHNNDRTEKEIDIAEIGLGPQFNIKAECSLLKTKFHRFYFYLTALSNERRILESIILSTEFKPVGKYMLSIDNEVMGHFDYTRQSLSIEIDMIESLLNYIQEKCNDVTRPFIKLCRDIISDFQITIKTLNSFDKTILLRKAINSGAFSKLENILTNLINQCRYLGINYTILAQKLLIKEANTSGSRRTMFIGH